MDKPPYTSVPVEELRRIENDVQRSESVEELRALFERVQSIRRTYIDDFDVQLAVGRVQQSIVDRGRVLETNARTGAATGESAPATIRMPEEAPPPASLPPGVEALDARSWKRATYIGAFFALILFAVFFYLIQTARKLNIPHEPSQAGAAARTESGAEQEKPNPATPKQQASTGASGPRLRLYTDLTPGTVVMDEGAGQALEDGQLELETVSAGRHTVRVAGRGGEASFAFEADDKSAPELSGAPSASEVLVVTVSAQDGHGHLMTNAQDARAILDGNDLGPVPAQGLPLENLGKNDHDLQIKRTGDAQRFILTYNPAPSLTVYLKRDLNAGTALITTAEDGVEIWVDGQKYRRVTEHGQVRIPNLKTGAHTIRVSKPGFIDPVPQTVQIKKGEEARVVFRLQPQPQVATLRINGALPGIQVFLDGAPVLTTNGEGSATFSNVKAGTHTIELRREGSEPKQIKRNFNVGETVTLAGPDVVLAAAAKPQPPATPPTPVPLPNEPSATGEAGAQNPPEAQPATMPGSVHRGGGYLIYHQTKAPGRYVFSMQLRKGGGFLKSKRLQWFAGYQDTRNYVLFQVDGKRLTVRQVADGKGKDLAKVPFETDLDSPVQVDMRVNQNQVAVRLRPSDGSWQDMGTISTDGGDLTKGKFGVLISGNDEVGVSTVNYSK